MESAREKNIREFWAEFGYCPRCIAGAGRPCKDLRGGQRENVMPHVGRPYRTKNQKWRN